MDILHAHCAGRDVHKASILACAMLIVDGEVIRHSRRFGTTTAELLEMADWLASLGVTHVAMESTGVYWKPVYHILEGRFALLLVNAQHIKRVPGRKTDVKDAEWIAQLLQHGLLAPSFVPPPPIRELRDLTRQRTQLVRERATVVHRIHKVLEDANIKLACVVTDILGKSGRDMIRALSAGETDPDPLAELARGSLRKKKPELRQALYGRVTDHHRFLLRTLMGQEEHLEGQIARYSERIAEVMAPFAAAAARLRQVPGIGGPAAEVIVAEIGVDMERFPTAGHLASWAGLCPGNHESAGKRRSGRTTKGSQWLRTTLVQVAWAATHTKQTVFGAAYRRWVKRLGKKKALVAVAHKILTVIYTLLKQGTDYREHWTPEAA
ncbi:MAG TPA: IS110 family transposase [Isosphaeraceae bacterium]|nr:IS110 family transposase [Isosphaeraceae bacterium]